MTWATKGAPGPKTRAMAKESQKVEERLWTSLGDPAIPVTYNLRERLLHDAVIWRALSHGTDSEAGAPLRRADPDRDRQPAVPPGFHKGGHGRGTRGVISA